MGLEQVVPKSSPYIGKVLRMAQPAVRHVGKNLWKYGAGFEGGKALLRGEGPLGIAQDAISGASTGALLQAGIPGGRNLLRGGLLKTGLSPDQALLASSVAVPAAAAGGAMLLGGQSGPANQVVGGARGAAGNVLGAGASRLNQESNIVSMSALPQGFSPDHQRMIQGPQGNWWYQLNPGELPAGIRLGRELDADTGTSVLNKYANAQFGQTERVAKAEMERQAAATQLLANIQVAKNLVEMGAKSGHNIAEQATSDVGSAMANRQNFRYF